MSSFRLDGRTALVTGASRGIGRGIALALAEAGATVICAARDQGKLDDVVTEIAAEEGWSVNLAKTRVLRKSMRQQLAGVVVNQHPNAPRAEVDRLKAILTNCIRHGPASQNRDGHADFRAHLQGRVAWVGQRNPARGERLRALFDAIPWQPTQPSPPTPQG